jgi:hypothetical protein
MTGDSIRKSKIDLHGRKEPNPAKFSFPGFQFVGVFPTPISAKLEDIFRLFLIAVTDLIELLLLLPEGEEDRLPV